MTVLLKYRKEDGFTQKVLSDLSGVSRTAIGEIENNRQKARPETMRRIAMAFKLPVDNLFNPDGSAKCFAQPPAPPCDHPCSVESPGQPDEEWIRIDEAASLLGSCPSTIESLAFDRGSPRGETPRPSDNGRLTYIVREGEDFLRFSRPWLVAYKNGRKPPTVPNRWQRAIQDARKPRLTIEQMQLLESVDAAAAITSEQPNGVAVLQELVSRLQAAIESGRHS